MTDREGKGGFPSFSEYVGFVSYEARVSNNSLRNTEEQREQTKTKSKRTDDKQSKQSNKDKAASTTITFRTNTSAKVGKSLFENAW